MNKRKIFICVAVICVVIIGIVVLVNKNGKTLNTNPLIGEWVCVDGFDWSYTFYEDGSYIDSFEGSINNGTWTFIGDGEYVDGSYNFFKPLSMEEIRQGYFMYNNGGGHTYRFEKQ